MYSRKPQARPDPVMARYNVFLSAAKSGEDGLCFKEHTFRSQRSGVFAPKEKPVTWSVAVADDRVDGTGAHSLKYLVRKVINDNIQELGQDALKETPWVPFGHWIYDDAVATRKAAWEVFTTAYPAVDFGSASYSLPVTERLPPLIVALTSPSTAWLVKLRILITTATTDSDLRSLGALRNLKALFITPQSGAQRLVDDGLVRSWGRAAAQVGGGFRFLETLGLRGFDTVTRNSLEYAGWMPALRFLMLDGCHWSVGKPVEGWVRVQEDGWMEARRLWKSERGGEGRGRERPVAKVRVGEVIQVNKRMTETQWRFVRNGGKREEKRKVEVPLERARPVVRKKRVRDIADMLADFAPKTFPTKK